MTYNALRVFALVAAAVSCFAAGSKKGFIEPPEPKSGQDIQLIYRADLPDATLRAGDTVIAIVTVWYPGRFETRRIAAVRAGDRLVARMTVSEEVGFLYCDFVSKDAAGGPAYAMVYTPEGKPARGARTGAVSG